MDEEIVSRLRELEEFNASLGIELPISLKTILDKGGALRQVILLSRGGGVRVYYQGENGDTSIEPWELTKVDRYRLTTVFGKAHIAGVHFGALESVADQSGAPVAFPGVHESRFEHQVTVRISR